MSVRRRQHVSASTYVDGNTVRKVQRTVEIRPERDEREEYRHKHAVRRNQEKALYMNGPYVLALTIAALITLVLCMNYLHKQASITTRINHIEDLELKLAPIPMYKIGFPVTERIEREAPPRVSPSSFVRITPSIPILSLKVPETLTAS